MARRKKLSPDPFDLKIDALSTNGRGLAVHEEKPLQVHGALPGELVSARFLFGRRMRGQAEVIEVLQASTDRIEPRCVHFGTCSACSLQHLSCGSQVAFKQGIVLGKLKEVGAVEPARILEPLQADAWHYRRKARLSVRYVEKKGGVLVGFRERDGRFVTQMSECHILPRRFVAGLERLLALLNGMQAARHIPQIELCAGDDALLLIFRHLEPLHEQDLAVLRDFHQQTGFGVYLQSKGPDTVEALPGCDTDLVYELPDFDLQFRFGPLDFIQVNASLNRAMVSAAIKLLSAGAGDHVLDLFCGLGNFSLPLARGAASVTGVEGDAALVRRAQENAASNGIGNARFVEADLYGEASLVALGDAQFSHVLLDPPRSGAAPVLPRLAGMGARRIVYVSCNPDTL
ncbi:MAG: 23S rRNA (uracil(1939)-C(5))-methyltransferase RlmD, partial [Gammaproteobacteria bacterium]|nr:23S rRNA (uracil(1939)-C(5))-methyltransferase RlmD [Gammaproteobacteria bacterium]